jgi:hypothetical protein
MGVSGIFSALAQRRISNLRAKVAATFPMKRMSVGVPQQETPFDVQGFLAEIEREENNH